MNRLAPLLLLAACGKPAVVASQSAANPCVEVAHDSVSTTWDCPYIGDQICEYIFHNDGTVEIVDCWKEAK